MLNVEHAIREVGSVYQVLTGSPIRPVGSELPPEVDAANHLEGRYAEFKRLLETAATASTATQSMGFTPAMDVIENEREVRFEFDLPGTPRDQVEVNLSGEFLIVRGGRNERAESSHQTYRHRERHFGPFQRIVALPPKARREGIEASLKAGVLSVLVPTDGTGTGAAEVSISVK